MDTPDEDKPARDTPLDEGDSDGFKLSEVDSDQTHQMKIDLPESPR